MRRGSWMTAGKCWTTLLSSGNGSGNDEDLDCGVNVDSTLEGSINSSGMENGAGKFVSNGNVRRLSLPEGRKQQLDAVNAAVSKVLRIVLHANQAVAHHELKSAMMAGGVEERSMRNKCLLDVALLTLLDHGLLYRHGYGNWGLYSVPAEAMRDATRIAFAEFPGEDKGWVDGVESDGVMEECDCCVGRQDDEGNYGDSGEFLDENMAAVCHHRSKHEGARLQTGCHRGMHTNKKRSGVQEWTACGRPAIALSPRARGAVRVAIGDRGLSRVRTGGAEKRTYSDSSGGAAAAAAAAAVNATANNGGAVSLKRARLRHHHQQQSEPDAMSP
eukprot:jgi/Picsp_1/4384/NSC_01890-R1_---NA---